MAVKFIRIKPNSKTVQKEVNLYFIDLVISFWDTIIDECNDSCYKRYMLYPNVHTIKMMRDRMKGVRQDDLEMIKKVFDID